MKIENSKVYNFEDALRGLRNPLESWEKSDSLFGIVNKDNPTAMDKDRFKVVDSYCTVEGLSPEQIEYDAKFAEYNAQLVKDGQNPSLQSYSHYTQYAFIGPNDMKLATRLTAAGPEHRKFLRQIFVSADITAPLYIWKELDTYKISTAANSTSTMHKIASRPITLDLFEDADFDPEIAGPLADTLLQGLEDLRQKYLETKDKRYWKELVRWLPNGWLQTRTWTANYEVLKNIYHQRANHKLTEWEAIRHWIESLPYADKFLTC